jgi:glycosyltransferase involved in cell wall biosynthesis
MTEPIPVLHVMNAFVDGSIARIVERIIDCSDRDRFSWHIGVVKPDGDFSTVYEKLGAQVVNFSRSEGENTPQYIKIRKYIKSHGIRIVHSHTPRTIFDVWLSLQKKDGERNYHLATKHLLTTPQDRRYGLIYTLIDLMSLYLPDHIVAVSETMAEKIKSVPGIDKKIITAIPNGIPCDDYFRLPLRDICRKELGIRNEQILIGFTGRISKVKQLDLLLKAFKNTHNRFPQTRLVLAGEGELRESLEALADSLGLTDSVNWLGYYPDIPRLLSAIDIYIQPSVNEGLSLSILEAMAAEKPVISTQVGSASEILQNGISGVLIPPGSAAEIEKALTQMIEQPDERRRLAMNAREFVLKEYNLQKMVDCYYRIYQQLIKVK